MNLCRRAQEGGDDAEPVSGKAVKPEGGWSRDPADLDPALWALSCVQPCPHTLGLPHPQLLGLSVATLAALTYFGAHFAVIGRASSDRTPYEAMHRWGK